MCITECYFASTSTFGLNLPQRKPVGGSQIALCKTFNVITIDDTTATTFVSTGQTQTKWRTKMNTWFVWTGRKIAAFVLDAQQT